MENEPLKKALDKAGEILQFAFDNANKPIDPKKEEAALAQLAALQKNIEEFDKANQKFLEGSEINDFTIQMMITDTKAEKVNEKQRELLKRAEELKNHSQAAAKNLKKAAQATQASEKKLTDEDRASEKKGKSRKGKFRSMGGTNWKPL